MPFVISLNQTFKRALSRRYFLSLHVVLQLFWYKILIYGFQIRKVHAKLELVVMFSSQQLIATTKIFFDEKKQFFTKILSKNPWKQKTKLKNLMRFLLKIFVIFLFFIEKIFGGSNELLAWQQNYQPCFCMNFTNLKSIYRYPMPKKL